jgi:thiamine biosynthesis lipoprotein
VNKQQLPTRLLLWLAMCLLLSCARPQDEKAEFFVFGTLVEVTLSDTDPVAAQAAFQQLQTMFQSMHRDWHAWGPGQLTDINNAFSNGQEEVTDQHMATLIQQSQLLETASGGRFNPAIGGLVERWGFHTSDYPIRAPVPGPAEIAKLLRAKPSTLDVQLMAVEGGQWQIQSSNPAVQLDFGGIAKGYAVDLALLQLRGQTVPGAIVNAGGDVAAFGSHGGKAWRIAVQNPLGGIIGIIETNGDEAVFSSGNYHRFGVDENGFRYAHILDPRTGWPVQQVLSATVIADSGIVADAAATALVVAGLDEWQQVAAGMQLDCILLTDENGKVYMTRAMQDRIGLAENMVEKVVLLD